MELPAVPIHPEIHDALSNLNQCYQDIINLNIDEISKKSIRLRLPIIPYDVLIKIVNTAQGIFHQEPAILRIEPPVVVVGDIHGHILDLFRILKWINQSQIKNVLFLGDLVDRGEFSLETISLVFILKLLFQDSVYLIRGNHEFGAVCDHGGFFSELSQLYSTNSSEIADSFLNAFSYLPFAADIDNYALCVHGGIGPSLFMPSQISEIPRPLNNYDFPVAEELLWSDPSNLYDEYAKSPRGMGNLFGFRPVNAFLESSGHNILVRGHQCVDGVDSSCRRVVTVFSASKYCGSGSNQSGVILIGEGKRYSAIKFAPLNYLRRYEVGFVPMDCLLKPDASLTPSPRRKGRVNKRSSQSLRDLRLVVNQPQEDRSPLSVREIKKKSTPVSPRLFPTKTESSRSPRRFY